MWKSVWFWFAREILMTTGVGIEMSRARNAFPKCHASSVLKCASTSDASTFAMASSCRAGEGVSWLALSCSTGTYIAWRDRDWPCYFCHIEISVLFLALKAQTWICLLSGVSCAELLKLCLVCDGGVGRCLSVQNPKCVSSCQELL